MKSEKLRGITALFLKGLLVAMVAVFCVLVGVAWTSQTKQAEEAGKTLLHSVVESVSFSISTVRSSSAGAAEEPTMDDIINRYSEEIQVAKRGGVIVLEKGVVVGNSKVDLLGKSVEETGISPRDLEGTSGYFHATISGTQYFCGFETEEGITVVALASDELLYSVRNATTAMLIVTYAVLFVVLAGAIMFLLKRYVISDAQAINLSLSKITAGQLDECVEARGNKEFSELSDGINQTVDSLKASIKKEAQRIDDELRYAQQIQSSVLPRLDDVADERFDIATFMKMAKEVGGDFYDFMYLDQDRVGLVIADVSDKGIPAAFCMMSVMNRVRMGLMSTERLDEMLGSLSNQLIEENSEMFVTLFAAVIDLRTGTMQMVNAGHNSPLVYRADETFEYLTHSHDLVLGGIAGFPYHGVTESMSKDGQLFGEERLRDILNNSCDRSAASLVAMVRHEVDEFSQGANQADDITMLCFARK
ncbi:MAG: SpoIIE family protein phosphatase [Raoultibacter sp.]